MSGPQRVEYGAHRDVIVLRVIKTCVVRGHVRVNAKHGEPPTECTVRQIVLPVKMYHDVLSINPALCANGVDDATLDKFLAHYGVPEL